MSGDSAVTELAALADAEPIVTTRLALEPLTVAHAEEMAPLLDDPTLHDYTGGDPVNAGELRERYARQVVGRSPDGSERWYNWVLRESATGRAVGYVQATVTGALGGLSAEIAWVVAAPHQGRGLASEGSRAMVSWLREHGVDVLVAHIHPAHHASTAVAAAVGLTATDTLVDGEVRWSSARAG